MNEEQVNNIKKRVNEKINEMKKKHVPVGKLFKEILQLSDRDVKNLINN